jgi:hypothetical protein
MKGTTIKTNAGWGPCIPKAPEYTINEMRAMKIMRKQRYLLR